MFLLLVRSVGTSRSFCGLRFVIVFVGLIHFNIVSKNPPIRGIGGHRIVSSFLLHGGLVLHVQPWCGISEEEFRCRD